MSNTDLPEANSWSGFRTWSGLQKVFLLQLIAIPIVLLIFRYIQPKVMAASFAGSLFVLIGIYTLRVESRLARRSRYLFYSTRSYLLLGCLPVMGILILQRFDLIDFGSLRALAHKTASILFLNLILATFWGIRLNREKPQQRSID